jgi:hypothetical protein
MTVAVALPVLQGCGATKVYPGPDLPDKDIAVIKGSRTVAGIRIYFSTVDEDGNDDITYKIEVPAGKRKIRLYFGTTDGRVQGMSRTLAFDAKGGHTYQVQGIEHDDRVWIWIEDTYSHQIVCGERP